MKYFIKALFVALLFINPVYAEDNISKATDLEFDWTDYTIYPEDKAAAFAFDLFPKTAEVAAVTLKLEHKDALIEAAKERKESSVANYNRAGLEAVSAHLTSIILHLAIGFIVYQCLAILYRGMNGENGIVTELKSKVLKLLVVWMIFLPISGVTPAGVLAMILFFVGIGSFNFLLAGFTNYMSTEIPDQGLYIDGDDVVTVSRAAENIPLTRSRQLIEGAVCLNQASLAGVYSDADTRGIGARRSAIENGEYNELSVMMDGTSTLHEVETKDSAAVIMAGWGLENAENPLICDTKTIKKPTPSTAIGEFVSIIDDEVKGLRNKTVTATLALDGWANIKSLIRASYDGGVAINEVLTQSANYYFSSLMFYAENGGIIEGSRAAYDTYNHQVALADKIAKELRARDCYGERTRYINTKSTIERLNRGYVGASSFDMSCAVLSGDKLEMAFDADSSSLSQFASDSLELASNHPVAVKDNYAELLKSFDAHVEITNAYISAIKKLRFDAATSGGSDYSNEYLEFLFKMRREGVLGFSFSFMPAVEMAGNIMTDLSKSRQDTAAINGSYSSVANYNAEGAYLPPNASQSKYKSASITLPAFIFSTNSEVDGTDISKTIESSFESQISTGQGNTTEVDSIKSSGYEYAMVGLDADIKPQSVASEELTNNIIYSIIEPFVFENTYKENGLTVTERRMKMLALCGKNEVSKNDIAELGGSDPINDLVNFCAKYSSQIPLIHKKNEGQKLVNAGATLLAASAAGGGAAHLSRKALNKANKLKGKKPSHDGGLSDKKKSGSTELKDIIPTGDGYVGVAIEKMLKGMQAAISNTVLQAIAGMTATLIAFIGMSDLVMYLMIPFMLLSMNIGYMVVLTVAVSLSIVFGLLVVMSDKKIDFASNAFKSTGMRLVLYPIFIYLFTILAFAAIYVVNFFEDFLGLGDVENIASYFSENFAITAFMSVVLMLITKIVFISLLAFSLNLAQQSVEGIVEAMAGDKSRDEGADTSIGEGAMYVGAQTSSKIVQNAMNRIGNVFNKTKAKPSVGETDDDLKAGAGASPSVQANERGRLRDVSTQSNTSTDNQVSKTEKPKSDIDNEADKPKKTEEIEDQGLESPENKPDDADSLVNEEPEPTKQDK
ncbi:hypothetical protein [Vibrio parahaemolyticus]|uniref:hypothetical protein n=1 Tax=Vibrio parahaemolyticus TaxID=670 RepID=UPI000B51C321|nr:hypothetical protein [Vibrio parahaemolyticus]OWT85921.1 hypothetical protein BGM05_23160 [Vibrio parahaemolyticus]